MREPSDEGPQQPGTVARPRFAYGSAFDIGRQALINWTHGMYEYGNELSRFAVTRLNRDFESWKALAQCHSPGEVFQHQSSWLQEALADYADEMSRLFQLMTNIAGDASTAAAAASPVQKPAIEVQKVTEVGPAPDASKPEHRPSARAVARAPGESTT